MDSIGDVVYGESFDCIQTVHKSLYEHPPDIDEHGGANFSNPKSSRLHGAINHLLKIALGALVIPAPILPIYWYICKLSKEWKAAYTVTSQFTYRRMTEAKSAAQSKRENGLNLDSADCVVDMFMENGTETLSDKEIMDELLGLIVAGQESTSATLSFGLKFLSNHPDVQIKLREELQNKFGTTMEHPLTYDDVSNDDLPYLEAVVAEILRCGRVAPLVRRKALEDFLLLGHVIPKGTNLIFLTSFPSLEADQAYGTRARDLDPVRSKTSLAHGLSKGYWDNEAPTAFRPERWLVVEGDEKGGEARVKFDPKRGVSWQFGLGQRSCFGAKLAMLQLKLIVASLNLAFCFDRVPEELNGFEVKEGLVVHPRKAYAALKQWPH